MMAQTDLVCSKCVGRRTVNNTMKVNSKVMVTTVTPDRPLAYIQGGQFLFPRVYIHIYGDMRTSAGGALYMATWEQVQAAHYILNYVRKRFCLLSNYFHKSNNLLESHVYLCIYTHTYVYTHTSDMSNTLPSSVFCVAQFSSRIVHDVRPQMSQL
jgi:hypothetical protein